MTIQITRKARPPNKYETAVLDQIAFEILQNLVIEGKLVPLTKQNEAHYVRRYELRKPST